MMLKFTTSKKMYEINESLIMYFKIKSSNAKNIILQMTRAEKSLLQIQLRKKKYFENKKSNLLFRC